MKVSSWFLKEEFPAQQQGCRHAVLHRYVPRETAQERLRVRAQLWAGTGKSPGSKAHVVGAWHQVAKRRSPQTGYG